MKQQTVEQWKWVDVDPMETILHGAQAGEDNAGGLPRAMALYDAGQLEEALAELARVLTSGSATLEANYARGHIQFELNRFEEAAASYAAVIAADPEHPSAHYNLGVCLEKLRQWAGAEESFRKALRMNPALSQARVGLGACLLHQDRPEEALAVFEQAQPQAAGDELELFGRAVALQVLSRYAEAQTVYEQLLAINPESEEALANLIAMGIARHDPKTVTECSRQLLQVRPQSRQALQGLTTLALWNGRGDTKSTPPAPDRRAPRLVEA